MPCIQILEDRRVQGANSYGACGCRDLIRRIGRTSAKGTHRPGKARFEVVWRSMTPVPSFMTNS